MALASDEPHTSLCPLFLAATSMHPERRATTATSLPRCDLHASGEKSNNGDFRQGRWGPHLDLNFFLFFLPLD
jgi:hypothetical protein